MYNFVSPPEALELNDIALTAIRELSHRGFFYKNVRKQPWDSGQVGFQPLQVNKAGVFTAATEFVEGLTYVVPPGYEGVVNGYYAYLLPQTATPTPIVPGTVIYGLKINDAWHPELGNLALSRGNTGNVIPIENILLRPGDRVVFSVFNNGGVDPATNNHSWYLGISGRLNPLKMY